MSLCFKWSCDFHRFTKSKTLRISGSHYTQFPKKPSQAFSLFNLQGTIRCFQGLFRTFRSSLPFSVTAYLVYQIVFSLSRTFSSFSNFFRPAPFLSEAAYLLYQTEKHLSRSFFISFKFFPIWRLLTEAARLVYYTQPTFVNTFLQKSWFYFK